MMEGGKGADQNESSKILSKKTARQCKSVGVMPDKLPMTVLRGETSMPNVAAGTGGTKSKKVMYII